MQYDEFIGQVQHRARLASRGEATRAVRATLETLGDRLFGGEAGNLAAQLPEEIGLYLRRETGGESFGLDEFFERVSVLEGVDLPEAIFHARAVMSVVSDAISPSLLDKVRAQLPAEYDRLFEAGSDGGMS